MHKILLIICTIATILIVGYLTYIYRSTGVPFYRHNDVYEILKTDSSSEKLDLNNNYTEPFKKYSLIDDEDELNRSYIAPEPPDNSIDTVADNGLILK